MTKIEYTVLPADCGLSIKQIFDKMNISTTIVKRFKYHGKITLNGILCNVSKIVETGDILCAETDEETTSVEKSPFAAEILYADKYLYVANKPYGIATHPDRAHKTDTLGNRLATALDLKNLHIVTRLDKTTSGVVLGAFDELTTSYLNEMQFNHEIEKTYVAVTDRQVASSGIVDLPLLRIDKQNRTIVDENGKPSQTKFETICCKNGYTYVRICPLTGRTHQIRAHFSAIGAPLLGDVFYGGTEHERVMLHCQRISFVHPFTKEKIEVSCPLPKEFDL